MVTVIVAVPALMAVTLPLLTVATEVFELLQLIFLFVALDGETVAVNVWLSPSVRVMLVLSRLTLSTLYTFAFTVTWQVAVLPPSSVVTVIVAVPALRAVTCPLLTVATDSSELFQLTFLFVALAGYTVAVKVSLSPSFRVMLVLSRLTLSTLYTFAFTVT